MKSCAALTAKRGIDVLPEAEALIPTMGRLPGVDGEANMSKSQNKSIALSSLPDVIREAVKRMYTDSNHLRASDPGTVEGRWFSHTWTYSTMTVSRLNG
jgi:tryptophanyl-tRNA synthetase